MTRPRRQGVLDRPDAPAPALVARAREVALIKAAVAACVDGESTVLEIVGDPGLGKTRLLTEAVRRADAHGLTVLSGRASEFEQERPFGVFAEPLRGCVDNVAADQIEALHDELPYLGLMPGRHDGPTGRSDVERFRTHAAAARLLEVAGGKTGVLLCLDDLHWADDGAVELLHYLLRRPPDVPLILACAYRPRQARARLAGCFSSISDTYRLQRLSPAPLNRDAVDRLLGAGVPPETRNRLYEASAGNPFYLEVLQRMCPPPGDGDPPSPASGHVTDLPHHLSAPLAGELARLTSEQLTVLRAAAVLGDPFDASALFAVAELPEDATLSALDVLAGRDLVRADIGTRWLFAFRHPIIRRVAYQEAPPGWRLAAHGRADRTLRDAGASVIERAPHVARAAQPGDSEAVRVLGDAAALTMRSAPGTAAVWLRAALRLVSAGASPTRLDLLFALSRALGVTGDLDGFRETLAQTLRLLPRDRPERVDVVALQAMVERILGSTATARAILAAELADVPDEDPAGNPLRLQLAMVRMTQRAYAESAAQLDIAVRSAAATGDTGVRTSADACRALGAAYSGQTQVVRRHATSAARSVDTMDDGRLAPHLDPLSQLGWAELLVERYDDALRHLTRGIEIARRTGQSHVMPYLLQGHSWAQGAVGQLADAVRSAEAAEEMAHLLGRSDLLGYALALRASAVSTRDSPDVAAPIAERALRHISPRGRLWGLAATVLGLIRLDQDRPGDCLALVESVSAKAQLSGPAWCVKATWYSAAARAEAVRGRLDAARGWADRAAEAAEAVDLDGQRAHALTARAYSLPVTSDEALELLGAALKGFEASGLVLGAAQTRLLLAQRHFATDRTDQAAEHIEQAKRTATAYGAGHLCALAVDAQRRLGARMPRGIGLVIPGPELSTREEVIVGLVTQGLSNRRIAESMYVSVKTVEAHLTRIFRKYGVSSRSALVSEYLHAAGTGSR